MAHGHRVSPHEAGELRLQDVALHGVPTDGIGSVQDDEGNSRFRRSLLGQRHGPDVGVVAGADVLDVEEEEVHPLQHLRGGLAGTTVQGVHGEARRGVHRALHPLAGFGGTPDAVLRPEEGHQLHLRMLVEEVHRGQHGVADARYDARVVGDEPHPASRQEVQAILDEHLGPHPDRRLLGQGQRFAPVAGAAPGGQDEEEERQGLSPCAQVH